MSTPTPAQIDAGARVLFQRIYNGTVGDYDAQTDNTAEKMRSHAKAVFEAMEAADVDA